MTKPNLSFLFGPSTLVCAALAFSSVDAIAIPPEDSSPDSSASVNQAASVDTPLEASSAPDSLATATPSPNPAPAEISASTSIAPFRFPHRRATSPGINEMTRDAATPWYRSTLGSLSIVLALIGLCFFALKRWVPRKNWVSGGGAMSVIARTAIDAKHGLVLVRVGQRLVLIGVSNDRLTALSEISEATEVAELVGKIDGPSMSRASEFGRLFQSEVSSFEHLPEDAAEVSSKVQTGGGASPTGLRRLMRRVRNLQSAQSSE